MSEQDPNRSPIPRWVLPVMGAVCCIVLVSALALGLRSLSNSGFLGSDAPGPQSSASSSSDAQNSSLRERVDASSLPYEEALDAPIEEGVKKVDYALLQALGSLAIRQSAITLEEVELRKSDGQEYHFQRMRLHSDKAQAVRDAIAASLITWAGNATLTKVSDTVYFISVNGVRTHELALAPAVQETDPTVSTPQTEPASPAPLPGTDDSGTTPATRPDPHQTPATSGRLAIVIDDLGESVHAARVLSSLSYPVTFAIWPRASHTGQIAEIGAKRGEEIIIHQPMEPEGYPEVRPGPGTVFVQMTPDQIRTVLSENLKMVPGAVGINNHMGSRFTQDRAAVKAAVQELCEHNLFVLDSWTHPRSVLYEETKNAGMTAYKRSVFIDNIRDVPSIIHQLEKAERIALSTGQAIAIGHPKPETLEALKAWEKQRNPAVNLVPVHSLRPE